MLNDLLGYYKRNIRKMKDEDIQKELNQINQIQKLLQQKLRKVS